MYVTDSNINQDKIHSEVSGSKREGVAVKMFVKHIFR